MFDEFVAPNVVDVHTSSFCIDQCRNLAASPVLKISRLAGESCLVMFQGPSGSPSKLEHFAADADNVRCCYVGFRSECIFQNSPPN